MSTTDVFTSSGTWLCPDYVTTVWARCWGGGGAGAGVTVNPSSSLAGGGGAGGAFAEKTAHPVTPGVTYTVTVGAARTGSTGNGGAGNDTWFDNNTTGVLAKGGAGGTSPVADGGSGIGGTGTTTGSIGDNIFKGGNGANGLSGNTSTFVGAGGGGAGSAANGSNGSGTSGGGGGSAQGGTGGAGRTTTGNGNAGSTYGGGGSGGLTTATTDVSGGDGAAGRVELEYTPLFTPAGGGVRAVSDVFVDVTSAPATIDTLTPVSGDVFLLTGNVVELPAFTFTSDNGLWTWSSAGSAMTRVTGDADGSWRDVREGTHAGARVFMTSLAFVEPESAPPVQLNGGVYFVNPSALDQVLRGGTAGPEGHVAVCPTVSGGGSWTVTHGLRSDFLLVGIAATASPKAYVTIGPGNWVVERTSLDAVTVKPPSGITAGDYEIMLRRAV